MNIQKFNDRYKEDTPSKLKDMAYTWIIDRYTRNGRRFNFSDRFVWKGVVYALPEMIGYIIFFTIFLFLAHISFEKYGEARTIVFFILLLIWRVQVGVKLLGKINGKVKDEN